MNIFISLDCQKKDARLLIIKGEQFYIDELKPEYNILKVPGSSLGFIQTEGSKALIRRANIGKFFSIETRALLSKAHKGKTLSAETKALKSAARETVIYVYDPQGILVNTLNSARSTAEYFDCHHLTIMRYIRNRNIFKGQWILSTSSVFKL